MDEQLLKELLALAEDPDYQAASEGLKAKIAKLIMMAKGGEAVPPSAPEGAALAVDPMAEPKDKKDDFAMRRAAIDASLKRAAADAAAIEKGAFMARLGHELQLTPEQEKKLAGMPVEHARIYADALKEAGAIKPNLQSVSLRQGPTDEPRGGGAQSADHADLLVDANGAPLAGNALRVRQDLIARYGADAVRRQMHGGA